MIGSKQNFWDDYEQTKFPCWDVARSGAWIEMAVARVARAEEEED